MRRLLKLLVVGGIIYVLGLTVMTWLEDDDAFFDDGYDWGLSGFDG